MIAETLFEEQNERLAAAVTSYGLETRSYNHSPEKREMDRQREAVTAKYEAESRPLEIVSLMCACLQRPYPHELSVHNRLRIEGSRDRWPWSLMRSEKAEESAW